MADGKLTVCATPIGNLEDISERLRTSLAEADVIYAEDTRRTGKLLSVEGISTPMRSLFEGNEARRSEEVISEVKRGKSVVLVSDAGMPSVSDPGARVVTRAHEEGLTVSVVPGPSSVTSALAVAGFGADRFAFEGFLPRRGTERTQRLARIADEDRPVVLFASPNRVAEDLRDLASHIEGTRRVAVAREMTKLHEEIWVGSLADAVEHWSGVVKGEITLVLEAGTPNVIGDEEAVAMGRELIADGHSLSDAARAASDESGVSRRVIYEALLADQGES